MDTERKSIKKVGRPSLLDKHEITLEDLEAIYEEEGSYSLVAARLNTTKRTIQKYLTRNGKRKRGRKKGQFFSKTRIYIETNPGILTSSPKEIADIAKKYDLSPSYAKAVLFRKKKQMTRQIVGNVRKLIRSNVAIKDVKGRYIPTQAIKTVLLPKWHWDKPVFVKVNLKDKSWAKIPTLIVPTTESLIEHSAAADRSPGTKGSS